MNKTLLYEEYEFQSAGQMTEFIKIQQPIQPIKRTATYRHELGTGADKLSEAEQEVLFSWENLGQLDREMTGKWKW